MSVFFWGLKLLIGFNKIKHLKINLNYISLYLFNLFYIFLRCRQCKVGSEEKVSDSLTPKTYAIFEVLGYLKVLGGIIPSRGDEGHLTYFRKVYPLIYTLFNL